MKKSDLSAKISGLGFFYRWHPEVAIRYLPLVKEINQESKNSSVLEVGSGGLGIAPYLKREVVGVDTTFDKPYFPLLKMVKGSAMAIPFPDKSFDIVLCVDTLEHVEKKNREKAIGEMIRVARNMVLIAVPCGEKAYEQDKILNEYYKRKFSSDYKYLIEQISYGLPDKKEILEYISENSKKQGKHVYTKTYPNESLTLRLFLMKGWATKNIFLDIFFRKIMLFALPLLQYMNHGDSYRQIFKIQILK